MEHLRIDEIVVGERAREESGDLDALAGSICRCGLLQPLIVDGRNRLVAGQRRLEACKRLGWPEVPVRRYDDLGEVERRMVELEENLRRKDLAPYERSKAIAALAEAAAR